MTFLVETICQTAVLKLVILKTHYIQMMEEVGDVHTV